MEQASMEQDCTLPADCSCTSTYPGAEDMAWNLAAVHDAYQTYMAINGALGCPCEQLKSERG